jgi:hypothetical protein
MPEQTNEDVVSGFIGLTVVLARRNETTPVRLKPAPARAIVTAAATRMNAGISSNGATKKIPHMAPAISTATAGGGILSSSACMGEGVRLWLFVFVALSYRETEAGQKKAISKKQSRTPIYLLGKRGRGKAERSEQQGPDDADRPKFFPPDGFTVHGSSSSITWR